MKSKYFNGIDVLYNSKKYTVPVFDVDKKELPGTTYPVTYEGRQTSSTVSLEMPDINSKEDAFNFIRDLPELTQALLYKALHMNDMRIDRAETIIFKNRKD